MRIVLIAWRNWSAGRRYRSLILNAKRLGHQVWGCAANHQWGAFDEPLSIEAFNELGVEAFGEEESMERMDVLNPDVVFGEHSFGKSKLEMFGQHWVAAHDRVGFFIRHSLYHSRPLFLFDPNWTHTHCLITNEGQREPSEGIGWPKDRIHCLGSSDLDFVVEPIDVSEVRRKLSVASGQALIGLFVNSHEHLEKELPILETLLRVAKEREWKVAIHTHPTSRRRSSGPEGRNWPEDWPRFRRLQDLGATFIVGYAPGEIEGVRFHRCQPHELMVVADSLVTANWDVGLEAYALGKQAHYLMHLPLGHMSLNLNLKLEGQTLALRVDYDLEHGNNLQQDPDCVTKYFYKLDGLWWQRVLDLAERLRTDP